MKMYNEFTCEAIPIIIGDKEHDKKQLSRALNYYKLIGNDEKVQEIRDILKYKY